MTPSKTYILRNDGHANSAIKFIENNWQEMAKQERYLQVEVSEYKSKRSLEQNKLLHAVLNAIAEQAWVGGRRYPLETWKELARRKFIGTEPVVLPDGTEYERGRSTATLNVEQFSEFIEQIYQWAADELGVIIAS